jgi:tRNA G37 N-methylase Trm5
MLTFVMAGYFSLPALSFQQRLGVFASGVGLAATESVRKPARANGVEDFGHRA